MGFKKSDSLFLSKKTKFFNGFLILIRTICDIIKGKNFIVVALYIYERWEENKKVQKRQNSAKQSENIQKSQNAKHCKDLQRA